MVDRENSYGVSTGLDIFTPLPLTPPADARRDFLDGRTWAEYLNTPLPVSHLGQLSIGPEIEMGRVV